MKNTLEVAAHTPGPWEYSTGDPTKRIPRIYTIADGPIADSILDGNPAIRQANAKLIAAAPDMLEALKDVESKIVDFEAKRINWRPDDFLFRVRNAIAKAEGQK